MEIAISSLFFILLLQSTNSGHVTAPIQARDVTCTTLPSFCYRTQIFETFLAFLLESFGYCHAEVSLCHLKWLSKRFKFSLINDHWSKYLFSSLYCVPKSTIMCHNAERNKHLSVIAYCFHVVSSCSRMLTSGMLL